jgi:beta-fructofuranosidase
MPLRLPDKWVWDFWLVRDGERHHVFYLQAPRSLSAPKLRHHNASIGHAVSDDLSSWTVLPDALAPGPDGSWDDLATWTGSVVARDDRWCMLYTGISRRDNGLVQRIGLACSDDLVRWEKHPGNPVLEADPRWYDLLDVRRWRDQSWRDPWVFRHPDGSFRTLVTARSPSGEPDGAGVVGHARSVDLVDWEVLPPITAAGEFAQVEVPQLVRVDGSYALLVSCQAEDHSRARCERLGAPGETGTFVLVSDELLGPFEPPARPLAPPSGPLGPLYAGKLVETEPGDWRFLAFRGDGDRSFLGEITDPLPVRQDEGGRLVVDGPFTTVGAGQ